MAPLLADRSLEAVAEPDVSEVDYGAWTGKALKDLFSEPLWAVVQQHPSAAIFPDGEGLAFVQAHAVAAVRAHVEAAPAWQVHIGDARTFVRACRQRYDLAVVDLFHGDGTPDYLLSADFFRDLRQCLTPTGVTVMNAFALDRRSANYRSLIATVQSVFPHLVVFRRPNQPDEPNMNTYLVAAAAAPTPT